VAQANPPGPPQEIRDKINRTKSRRPGKVKAFILTHPLSPGVVETVNCKLCDLPIRTLIPDERFFEQTVIKGQTIKRERLIMASLPNYQELELTFDDGSKHVTATCKNCSNNLTIEDLEDMYAIDMEQARIDEARGLGEVRWHLWNRDPVSHRRL